MSGQFEIGNSPIIRNRNFTGMNVEGMGVKFTNGRRNTSMESIERFNIKGNYSGGEMTEAKI